MEDYAGKTDRDLLIELYVTMKNNCDTMDELKGIIENQQGEIGEIRSDVNKAKGGVAAVGGFSVLISIYLGLKSIFSF